MNVAGVSMRQSKYSVKDTVDRIHKFLQEHGVTVYARIDQQNEAATAGIDLLPLEFILFGNPRAGVPLMIENPLVSLDLPLKIIVYEDKQKKVWIAYNEAEYIEKRYSLLHDKNSSLALDHIVDTAMGA